MRDQRHRLVNVSNLADGEHRLVVLDQGDHVRSGDVAGVHDDELEPGDVPAEAPGGDGPGGAVGTATLSEGV